MYCQQVEMTLVVDEPASQNSSDACQPWEVYDPQSGVCSRFYCTQGSYYDSSEKQCRECHPDCLTCTGPASSQCASCLFGYYLKRKSNSLQGECTLKQIGEYSATLIVTNDVTVINNGKHNSERTGTEQNPFIDLRDALLKAESLGSLYNSSQIHLFLTKGDHFIPLEEEEQRFSTLGQPTTLFTDHTSIIIKPLPCSGTNEEDCVSESDSVSVFVKIGAYFQVKVSSFLKIQRVVFDFSDSLLEWNSVCQRERRNSCSVIINKDLPITETIESGCNCIQPQLLAETCSFNSLISLFSTLHNPHVTESPQIILEDVGIKHLHTAYNSLFGFSSISLLISNSLFQDISICGSIINSQNKLPYTNTTHISRVQAQFTKIRSYSFESNISIYNSDFKHIGLDLNYSSVMDLRQVHYQSTIYQSRAPILNVKNLKGEISIIGCHFESNKMFFDFSDSLNINQQEIYPPDQLIVKQSGLLKGGLILIQEHAHGVQIVDNTFLRNSGIRGIIEVRVKSEYERGVFIYGNNFTHNTGYYRANCLNLRSEMSQTSEQSCSGFHIENNYFIQNTNLPAQIAQVFMGCIYNMKVNNADDLDGSTLFFVNGLKPAQGINNPQSLIQNYTTSLGQQIEADYKNSVVRGNYFIQNFRGKGEGMIFQSLYINSLQFQENNLLRNGEIAVMKSYEDPTSFWIEKSGIHQDKLRQSTLLKYDQIKTSSFKIFGDVSIFILGSTFLKLESNQIIQTWYELKYAAQFVSHIMYIKNSNTYFAHNTIDSLLSQLPSQFFSYLIDDHSFLSHYSPFYSNKTSISVIPGSLMHLPRISIYNSIFQNIRISKSLIAVQTNSDYSLIGSQFYDLQAQNIFSAGGVRDLKIFNCSFFGNSMNSVWLNGKVISINASLFDNQDLESPSLNCALAGVSTTSQKLELIDSLFTHINGNKYCYQPLFQAMQNATLIIGNSRFYWNTGLPLIYIYNSWLYINEGTEISKNSGEQTCGILLDGQSYASVVGSSFSQNKCSNGVVFKIQKTSSLVVSDSIFSENESDSVGGVLAYWGKSQFSIHNSLFFMNKAKTDGSVIFGMSELKEQYVQTIHNSSFLFNEGRNVIGAFTSTIQFIDNHFESNLYKQFHLSPILIVNSNLFIEGSFFSGQNSKQIFSQFQDILQNGGYIMDLTRNNLTISQSIFQGGYGYNGGAIYSAGYSDVSIQFSLFYNNLAHFGGALYVQNYNNYEIKGCIFQQNYAFSSGADLYSIDSVYTMKIEQSTFRNGTTNSLIGIQTKLIVKDTLFANVTFETSARENAVLRCFLCLSFILSNSSIMNVRNSSGVFVDRSVKFSFQKEDHFVLINNTFRNLSTHSSGAGIKIYQALSDILIQGNVISDCQSFSQKGGAFFSSEIQPSVSIRLKNNHISNCRAQMGGAVYWDKTTPIFLDQIRCEDCVAQYYGSIKASYGIKLAFLDQGAFEPGWTGTVTNSQISQQFLITSQGSGHALPGFKVVLVDRSGQIVSSTNSSQPLIMKMSPIDVNSGYPPIFNDKNKNEWIKGVIKVEDLLLIGEPGQSYKLRIQSQLIDSQLPDSIWAQNEGYPGYIEATIHLRECLSGQAFLPNGQCKQCDPQFYLIEPPTTPTSCIPCPQRAVCYGGNQIGPAPSFWRPVSNSSKTIVFLACFNPEACLGALPSQDFDPQGSCQQGYTGVLCSQCIERYSRNQKFECERCPQNWKNFMILSVVLVVGITCVVIIIKYTLASISKQKSIFTIYFRILASHLQLLVLISTFKFKWPSQIVSLFQSTQTIAEAPQQLFSLDCFFEEKFSRFINRVYVYSLIYFLLPIGGALLIILFWCIAVRKKAKQRCSLIVSTLLIFLFLIHPTVTSQTLKLFNCVNIDGTYRLKQELEQVCWRGQHLLFALTTGILGVLFWIIGVPLCVWLLLYDERNNITAKSTIQKYGFLIKGYKPRSYYWELLTILRKISVSFISIFLSSVGNIVQALVLFLLLMGFIYLNIKIRPYENPFINRLEVFSLVSIIVTVYCGIFFLSSRDPSSHQFISGRDYFLSSGERWFFFSIIIIFNFSFVIYWQWKLLGQLRSTFRKRCPRFFMKCCLCGNRRLYNQEVHDEKKISQNQAIIRQIQEIQSELQTYRALYLDNEDFIGKNHFQELLFQISNKLKRAHKWKQTLFVQPFSHRSSLGNQKTDRKLEEDEINAEELFESEQNRFNDYDIEFRQKRSPTKREKEDQLPSERRKLRRPSEIIEHQKSYKKSSTNILRAIKKVITLGGRSGSRLSNQETRDIQFDNESRPGEKFSKIRSKNIGPNSKRASLRGQFELPSGLVPSLNINFRKRGTMSRNYQRNNNERDGCQELKVEDILTSQDKDNSLRVQNNNQMNTEEKLIAEEGMKMRGKRASVHLFSYNDS